MPLGSLLREANATMELGAFSISLAVKDISASREFYTKLGFEAIGGEQTQGWLILRNGETTIGLFQGMFERNTLTFNPGWTSRNENLSDFTDIREIRQALEAKGIVPASVSIESDAGPGSLALIDPDGNPVLLDQHVDSPPNSKNR